MTAPRDPKSDLRVQFIKKGQVATFEVDGGFCRKPAPSDGLLVESTTTTVFVPMDDLRKAGLQMAGHSRPGAEVPGRSQDDDPSR